MAAMSRLVTACAAFSDGSPVVARMSRAWSGVSVLMSARLAQHLSQAVALRATRDERGALVARADDRSQNPVAERSLVTETQATPFLHRAVHREDDFVGGPGRRLQ